MSAEPRLPPVTVVLSAYNLEAQIGRTLQALQQLDYPEVEIIVVDDGSTDHTAEVVRRHPVQLIQHGQNQGVAAARNTGVRAARHDILYLLDADCVVQAGTLRRLVEKLLSDPKLGVVSGSYLSEPGKQNLANRVYDVAERYRDYVPGARVYAYTTVSNAILRRSTFDSVGGFSVQWRRIQDYEFTYRVHQAGYVNLHDPSIPVVHNNHRERLGAYYAHIYQIAKFGTMFRLIHRPTLPYSRFLIPSLPVFVLLSPVYFLLHTAKVCVENLRLGRLGPLFAVLPFVVWSRVVYTAGSVAGCAHHVRGKQTTEDGDSPA